MFLGSKVSSGLEHRLPTPAGVDMFISVKKEKKYGVLGSSDECDEGALWCSFLSKKAQKYNTLKTVGAATRGL